MAAKGNNCTKSDVSNPTRRNRDSGAEIKAIEIELFRRYIKTMPFKEVIQNLDLRPLEEMATTKVPG